MVCDLVNSVVNQVLEMFGSVSLNHMDWNIG